MKAFKNNERSALMDPVKYRSITDRYIDSVYKAALSCSRCREDAEDAVQTAFLKLLKTDTEFTDDEHVKRWLIRVAVNECKSGFRSFWHRNKVSFDDLDVEPSYRDETHSDLLGTLARLPQNYKSVIHLYYYEGYDVRETAEILGISESNVQIRLMRARKKMKELLETEA